MIPEPSKRARTMHRMRSVLQSPATEQLKAQYRIGKRHLLKRSYNPS
jgi:hypothetical protein